MSPVHSTLAECPNSWPGANSSSSRGGHLLLHARLIESAHDSVLFDISSVHGKVQESEGRMHFPMRNQVNGSLRHRSIPGLPSSVQGVGDIGEAEIARWRV